MGISQTEPGEPARGDAHRCTIDQHRHCVRGWTQERGLGYIPRDSMATRVPGRHMQGIPPLHHTHLTTAIRRHLEVPTYHSGDSSLPSMVLFP